MDVYGYVVWSGVVVAAAAAGFSVSVRQLHHPGHVYSQLMNLASRALRSACFDARAVGSTGRARPYPLRLQRVQSDAERQGAGTARAAKHARLTRGVARSR